MYNEYFCYILKHVCHHLKTCRDDRPWPRCINNWFAQVNFVFRLFYRHTEPCGLHASKASLYLRLGQSSRNYTDQNIYISQSLRRRSTTLRVHGKGWVVWACATFFCTLHSSLLVCMCVCTSKSLPYEFKKLFFLAFSRFPLLRVSGWMWRGVNQSRAGCR